jgi:hypothetical protein
MVFFKRPSQAFRFEWEGQQLEIVDEFRYLEFFVCEGWENEEGCWTDAGSLFTCHG